MAHSAGGAGQCGGVAGGNKRPRPCQECQQALPTALLAQVPFPASTPAINKFWFCVPTKHRTVHQKCTFVIALRLYKTMDCLFYTIRTRDMLRLIQQVVLLASAKMLQNAALNYMLTEASAGTTDGAIRQPWYKLSALPWSCQLSTLLWSCQLSTVPGSCWDKLKTG